MKRFVGLVLGIFVCTAVHAQSRTFGSWNVIRADNGDMIAATFENGTSLGLAFRCFKTSDQCVHVLVANIKCDNGKMVPVLVNSDYSSLSMDALCNYNPANHNSELLLTEYDQIHEIIKKSNIVGFSIPLANGLFKVIRFRLNGASQAMDYASSSISTATEYQ